MAFTKVVGAGIHTLAQLETHNIHSAGIVTATKFVGEMESGGGSSTFQNVTIAGNLTVNGTTTTLDTDLMGVDKIEVAANNTTVAVAVTQSGAGDLLRLFDSTTEVLRITDDGLVGIGTDNPSWDIHAHKSSGTTQIAAKNIGGNATFYAEASSGNTAKIELMQAGTSSYSLRTGSDDALQIYRDSSEKLRIDSSGQLIAGGVSSADSSALINIIKDTTEVLADNEPLYNNASPAFLTVYNSNNTGSGEEAGINIVPAGNANGAISIYGKKTGSYAGDLIFRFRSGASTSAERLRITSGGDIQLQGGTLYGDDSALPTFTIANTSGNSNNCKINLGENVGSDNGGIGFYTAGSSSSDLKMRIRGNNDFIDIIDDNRLRFHDGKLYIYHNGSNGYVVNGTGQLLYRSDTHTFENAAGNVEGLRIDSSGNVMMGRTTASKKVSVRETSTSSGVYYNAQIGGASHLANYAVGIAFDPEGYAARTKIGIVAEGTGSGYSRGKLHFLLDSVNDSGEATLAESRMTILDDGNIGIGIVNPTKLLDIAASTSADGIRIKSTGNTYNELSFDANRDAKDTHLGRVISYWNGNAVSYISMDSGDAAASGKNKGYMRFWTADGSGNFERLRIASDGKATFTNKVQATSFGAGTVPDDHMGIHILQANPRILIKSSGTNAAKIFFGDSSSNDPGVIEYAHGSNTMFFGTNNDGNRLAIDSDGNILIGGETTTSYPVDISYTNNTVYSATATIGNAIEIHNLSTTAGTSAGVHMYITGNGANAAAVHLNAVHTANGTGDFTLGTRHSAGQHIERVRVTSIGKVSICDTGVGAVGDPFTGVHLKTAGYDIASGNAIKNSTMGGITVQMESNDDKSVGLWFGTNNAHWSGISGQRSNSATTWGTDLRFYTHESATNDLTYTRERLRITDDGKVGIKNTSPSEMLQIGDGSGTTGGLKVAGQSSSVTDDGLTIDWTSSNEARLFSESSGDATMHFYTTSSGTRGERLRIKSDGRIGFGGLDPASYYGTYDDFVWGATSGSVGMTIVSGSDSAGYLSWADGTSGADTYRGRFFYNHADNGFHFRTNGQAADALHIQSNSDITIVTGEGKINGRLQSNSGSGGYNRSFGCGLITKNFYIYGDSDKYYPVEIIPYGSSTMTHLAIYRAYSEHGPNDWNTASHKGGLTLEMMTRVGGWGGYTTHGPTIFYLGEVYATLLGGMNWTAHTQKYCIWLRGGGAGGALYHIESPNGNIAYAIHDDTSHTGTGAGYYYSSAGTAGEGNNSNTARGWATYYHSNASYRVYADYIGNSTTLTNMRNAFKQYNITGAHTTHGGGAHNP